MTCIDVTPEAGRSFFKRNITGPVVMLNLLRFRNEADYSSTPDLAPEHSISGRRAFELYVKHTRPHLTDNGGEVLFIGDAGPFLIGPPDEHWDLAMLIRHRSVSDFLSFASNEAYLVSVGHRSAALADARLLPIVESAP